MARLPGGRRARTGDVPQRLTGSIEVSLHEMPELIWQVRREMARFLRREAKREGELQVVADRLRGLADIFEAGGRGE